MTFLFAEDSEHYPHFPDWAQQLFGSGIMTGTTAAICAQALVGKD